MDYLDVDAESGAPSATLAAPRAFRPNRETGDGGPASAAASAAAAFEAVLCARAPGVHESTQMVTQLASSVGHELGLDARQQALLGLSIRMRDIGMATLPDRVLLAVGSLSPTDWEQVNRHPAIGADLLQGVPAVASAAEIVRCHHERWDGAGYPEGRREEAIPLLSRVIAVCDAFAAIATDRPHRQGIGAEAALDQVCNERGSQFDPRVVDALVSALRRRRGIAEGPESDLAGAEPELGLQAVRVQATPGRRDLAGAMAEFQLVPVFAPAYERVIAATTEGEAKGPLVPVIESDIGLSVAVLRRAQQARKGVTNVADAVAVLTGEDIQNAISALPRAEFPWRTSPLEVLLHSARVHAQAVTRAVDRLARELQLVKRDDLLTAALLHDIGKLVLGRAVPEYATRLDAGHPPEERIRREQRALGLDHASLGGLLLSRWGLPSRLVNAVAAHHSADAAEDLATHVRLADMVAHHAQGQPIDRNRMLELARTCGLSSGQLRDVLFDVPHAGGSQRRRAEPSPLSRRETEILRVLSQGKVYKTIAQELGLSPSTVRTHLHNTYDKLGVADRAQAVLLATQMGWI